MTVKDLRRVLHVDALEFCNHNGSRTFSVFGREAVKAFFRDFAAYEVLELETGDSCAVCVWLAI